MDPEIRKALDEIHALTRDNHRLLRAVRRHQILETFGKLFIWAVVIVAGVYAYIGYVYPLIERYQANPQQAASNIFGLPTLSDLQNLVHSYQPGK